MGKLELLYSKCIKAFHPEAQGQVFDEIGVVRR